MCPLVDRYSDQPPAHVRTRLACATVGAITCSCANDVVCTRYTVVQRSPGRLRPRRQRQRVAGLQLRAGSRRPVTVPVGDTAAVSIHRVRTPCCRGMAVTVPRWDSRKPPVAHTHRRNNAIFPPIPCPAVGGVSVAVPAAPPPFAPPSTRGHTAARMGFCAGNAAVHRCRSLGAWAVLERSWWSTPSTRLRWTRRSRPS